VVAIAITQFGAERALRRNEGVKKREVELVTDEY
jgi:hypothetical protein